MAALIIKGSAFLAIISLILIFVFIGKEALPVFTSSEVHEEVDLHKLFLAQSARDGDATSYTWQPVSSIPKYSLLPLLVGTLKATIIAVLIAIPLAVAAALFTSDFALPWARETIKPAIEILAGIPSVVVGFRTFCPKPGAAITRIKIGTASKDARPLRILIPTSNDLTNAPPRGEKRTRGDADYIDKKPENHKNVMIL